MNLVGPKRIFQNHEEKQRLMKLGQAIGPGLKQFIAIVTYPTYLSWLRKEKGGHTPKKMGRPRTVESIRELIVKIGTETGWGYTRIMKVMREAGIRVKKNSVRAPNLQAHIERFVQSIQQEALDHFIEFGERHFDYLVSQYVEHYHTERPHQAMGNVPLMGKWPPTTGPETRSDLWPEPAMHGPEVWSEAKAKKNSLLLIRQLWELVQRYPEAKGH